jgi:hypothetical protein
VSQTCRLTVLQLLLDVVATPVLVEESMKGLPTPLLLMLLKLTGRDVDDVDETKFVLLDWPGRKSRKIRRTCKTSPHKMSPRQNVSIQNVSVT